jgi:hypothetical protein
LLPNDDAANDHKPHITIGLNACVAMPIMPWAIENVTQFWLNSAAVVHASPQSPTEKYELSFIASYDNGMIGEPWTLLNIRFNTTELPFRNTGRL